LRIEAAHLRILTNFLALQARGPQDTPKVIPVADGFASITDAGARFVPNVDGRLRYCITPRVLDQLEERCRNGIASLSIELCSASNPALIRLLAASGYHPAFPADVLVCPLMPTAHHVDAAGVTVQRPGPDELPMWAHVLAHGFEIPETELAARFLLACGLSPGAMPLLARLRPGFAGAALPACQDGIAWLFAFSTLAAARQRGVQSALIATTLEILPGSGCDFAAAEATSGTSSHRNFQKLGFNVLYQRWDFTKHFHPSPNAAIVTLPPSS